MSEKLEKIKKALFGSEQHYQSLVDSIPDIVYTLNEAGEFIAVNNEFINSLGYSREELLNTPFANLLHPDDVTILISSLREIVYKGTIIRGLECRIKNKEGTIKHFELNQRGIYGLAGELLYIEGVAHDISERRKAEERTRRLKEFLESIINSIRSGIVVVDPKTYTIISANKSYCKQVNFPEDQVVGHNYYEISHYGGGSCNSKRWRSLLDETVFTGENVESDHVHFYEGLGTRYVEVSSYPIKNEKNEITEIILIERDITEKRRIEEELKRRVSELSILKDVSKAIQSTLRLEEMLYIILVGVTAGQGLNFNRAFLLLLNEEEGVLEGALAIGPSSPEEAGRIWAELDQKKLPFPELLTSYDPARLQDTHVNRIVKRIRIPVMEEKHILIQALMEGKAFNVKGGSVSADDGKRADAHLITLLGTDSFAVVPLYARSKRIGVMLADNLITEWPITDEEINSLQIFSNHASSAIENSRLYRELEKKYKDLEQANSLIREKQVELLEAERLSTVGRMAALLAHEIRNPLVSIGGFTRSIMNDLPTDDPRREELSIVLSEAMRLEELVKNVLEYAKFAKPKPKPTALTHLIKQVVDLVKYELRSNNIQLTLNINENAPPLLVDENQMRQVFINLIFNSMHAMPNGGELKIEGTANGKYAEIKVEDTGCGIEDEHLEKVFSPFFTTKSKGSGLGLHLVSQIITEHHGHIVVDSKPKKGTIFTIYLPIVEGGTSHENHIDRR